MKNPKNVSAFSTAALARISECRKLGISVSWRTQDHLGTLAAVLQANPSEIPALLEDAYNVSAWQQTLARTFKKEGLFQRESEGRTTASVLDGLIAEVAKMNVAASAATANA